MQYAPTRLHKGTCQIPKKARMFLHMHKKPISLWTPHIFRSKCAHCKLLTWFDIWKYIDLDTISERPSVYLGSFWLLHIPITNHFYPLQWLKKCVLSLEEKAWARPRAFFLVELESSFTKSLSRRVELTTRRSLRDRLAYFRKVQGPGPGTKSSQLGTFPDVQS